MNQPKHVQRPGQQIIGPKTIVIYRNSEYGFGFTLRHFIVYPDSFRNPSVSDHLSGILNLTQPMDTVFVKEVRPNGAAHAAGLKVGDRLLSVNGMPVAGTPYNAVVKLIQQAPTALKLIVVPEECDILQTLFSDSAHNPETNQRPRTVINQTEFDSRTLNGAITTNTNTSNFGTVTGARLFQQHPINPPKLNSERMQSFLNEAVNRHSFNESIYSEPYPNHANRFDTLPGRLEARAHQNGQSFACANNVPGPMYQNPAEVIQINGNQSHLVQSAGSQRNDLATPVISHSSFDTYATLRPKDRREATVAKEFEKPTLFEMTKSLDRGVSNAISRPYSANAQVILDSKALNQPQVRAPQKLQIQIKTQTLSQPQHCQILPEKKALQQQATQSIQREHPITILPQEQTIPEPEQPTSIKHTPQIVLDKVQESPSLVQSPVAQTDREVAKLALPSCSDSDAQSPTAVDANREKNPIVVLRRQKHVSSSIERPVRRISYLRATANDTSLQDSNSAENSDISEKATLTEDDMRPFIELLKRDSSVDKNVDVSLDGKLNLKVSYIDGKRNPVRPWHSISAEVRGNKLAITVHAEGSKPETSGVINLNQFHVTKSNYTKRKHVFKLTTQAPKVKPMSPQASTTTPTINSKTEFLIQAEDQTSMESWKTAIQKASIWGSDSKESPTQLQSPQDDGSGSQSVAPNASPNLSEKDLGLSKSRTWKDLVARQFRRIQGQANSPNSNLSRLPDGASIGVPLSQCPVSEKNKLIPLIMERCTEVVESKGLHIVGIYRIPGNTAAISALTEQVNRGFDEQTLSDPKWDDVNVVSSLLKLFLRRLPEALLPNDMYNSFIEADKETDQKRMLALKALIEHLPPQSNETLKHLMRHLNLVSKNCDTNLMEPKNLAIIFGPSVVRTSNETLEIVVKDMKHQCRIVEALVLHYEFFFENGNIPTIYEPHEAPKSQTNLLLDNVSKIEQSQMEKSRFVFKFVQAARNKKTKKKSNRKTVVSSVASDTMSMDSSSTSTEYKDLSVNKSTDLPDDDDVHRNSLSADDSTDLFFEDNGSMSLATLIPALEDKFHSLRSSTYDFDAQHNSSDSGTNSVSTAGTSALSRNMKLDSLQPLTMADDSIPFADDSPDQPILPPIATKTLRGQTIAVSSSPWYKSREATASEIPLTDLLINSKAYSKAQDTVDAKSINSISSDDTDESNTSDLIENQTLRTNCEMILEMTRILTTLERKATKLNRSLSLNIKYHNGDCCCNNVMSSSNPGSCRSIANNHRYSLTKDEKTDKNINKKRQIQDIKNKRYTNRPIKRRHTVGGIHYYNYNTKTNATKQHQAEGSNNR